MTTLSEAKMSSLKDKILGQKEKNEKEIVKVEVKQPKKRKK